MVGEMSLIQWLCIKSRDGLNPAAAPRGPKRDGLLEALIHFNLVVSDGHNGPRSIRKPASSPDPFGNA